ncbi:MAG: hypothetical protein Q4C95_12110 [Planctomycetia bacterium]|nr:hypothetical protein [Planctomycetia bacterium]
MLTGISEVEITPKVGVDLQGFAVRPQPSQSVGDSLMVRALYLQNENEQPILWLVFDLLGLMEPITQEIRTKIESELLIPASRIMISSTHTHSGPGVTHLFRCGNYCSDYAAQLPEKAFQAALRAINNRESCRTFFIEASSSLGRDRHTGPERKTDFRIPVLFWEKMDGSNEIKAVLTSYSMHPVCLKDNIISADWPGEVSRQLCQSLPGHPITLVCSGACGNIDPPQCGVSYNQMISWGQEIAQSILQPLTLSRQNHENSEIHEIKTPFLFQRHEFQASTYDQTKEDVIEFVRRTLEDGSGTRSFGEIYRFAATDWQKKMFQQIEKGTISTVPIRYCLLKFDHLAFVSVNVEMFCHLTQLIEQQREASKAEIASSFSNQKTYVIGNGDFAVGYLGVRSAYEAHSYEVDESCLFYGRPRFKIGTLEELANAIAEKLE